jgi:predicted nucleic acid-binding protein
MIVLDTNVLSELMKPAPASEVLGWFATQPADSLFTTALNQAEILFGIELLPKGKRREALHSAARAMFLDDFAGRVLPFDSAAADLYSRIAAARQKGGRPISHFDAQIAAIALCRGATLATRNLADFRGCDLELIDPWAD